MGFGCGVSTQWGVHWAPLIKHVIPKLIGHSLEGAGIYDMYSIVCPSHVFSKSSEKITKRQNIQATKTSGFVTFDNPSAAEHSKNTMLSSSVPCWAETFERTQVHLRCPLRLQERTHVLEAIGSDERGSWPYYERSTKLRTEQRASLLGWRPSLLGWRRRPFGSFFLSHTEKEAMVGREFHFHGSMRTVLSKHAVRVNLKTNPLQVSFKELCIHSLCV